MYWHTRVTLQAMLPKRYGPYVGTKYGHLLYTDEYPDGRRVTVWVHREVMASKLGRALLSGEIVHHVDGNPSNNAPENLELQTRSTHASMHHIKTELVSVVCPECEQEFVARARDVRRSKVRGRLGLFCDKQCAGRYGARRQRELGATRQRAGHGVSARYRSGCRCSACRAGHAAAVRTWKANK